MPTEDQDTPSNYRFSGFVTPNYTQIPDQVFDELLPLLTGNELKILMYICRRTFGFKKDTDNISLAQMVSGITTKDGTKLDGGTGLSKASVARALKDLEEKNIIVRVRRSDPQRGDLPTTYQLNVIDPRTLLPRRERGSLNSDLPRVSHRDTPLSHAETPRVPHRDTQETVRQETELSTTINNAQNPSRKREEAKDVVATLISWGISQNVSEMLAKRFSPDYVGEKIEFLQFLIEQGSVKKPAAWLRKAIEEDYSAPDRFRSADDREREANEEKKRKQTVLAAQNAHFERSKQQRKAQEAEKSARLQKLYQQYGTSKTDLAFWAKAKEALAANQVSDAILISVQLLKLEKDKVILHVINHFMAQQVSQPRVKQQLANVLTAMLNHPVELVFVVGDEE